MNAALLIGSVTTPLLVALLAAVPRMRGLVVACAGWTPLVALSAVLTVPAGTTVDVPWLLLGTRLELDASGQIFLAFTGLLYLLAGVYAAGYLSGDAARPRFFVFYLVTMAGNLGLILAQDVAAFLTCYSTMSITAYGLITHDGGADGRRAGRVYMLLVILGEVLLFAGLVLAAWRAESLLPADIRAAFAGARRPVLVVALLLTGFGIKLGIVPLHFWLPLAHPVAPTPASAVLSGAMIKAGLVGLLRFLPLGELAWPGAGQTCIVLGFLTAFFGVVVGLTQTNAKTVLAYSSVSQMGLVLLAIGAALAAPDAWPSVLTAVTLFACHHAIAKGALFLGVGIAACRFAAAWQRALVVAGLLVPAAALAGAPFTLGGAAKVGLKYALTASGLEWSETYTTLLAISSLATTLLLARFLYLARPGAGDEDGTARIRMWLPWSVLSTGVIGLFLLLPSRGGEPAKWTHEASHLDWHDTWPLAIGAAMAAIVWRGGLIGAGLARLRIPAGDVVVPITAILRRLGRLWNGYVVNPLAHGLWRLSTWWSATTAPRVIPALSRVSAALENWGAVGLLIAILAAALFVLSVGF